MSTEESEVTKGPLTCNECGKTKDISQFPKNRWGFTKVCLECRMERRVKGKAPTTKIKNAREMGFVIKTRSYVCCPKCGEIIGQADDAE